MRKNLVLVLLLISALSVPLFAGGFALSGVGSRATAMGGAFRGLSDDASAMYWNPAGLAFQNGNSIALGGTFIMPSAKWENNGPIFTQYHGFQATEYEAKKSLKAFPNAFLTMANHSKLKYGLGVFVPYGLGSTWDVYDPSIVPYMAGHPGFPQEEMMSSIAIFDVHPSVAYQIMPDLSVGAGLSLFYGMIDMAQVQFSKTVVDTLGNYIYVPTSSDMSGSGIGFGANIGVMYKPMKCLSLGLSAKIPSQIKMNGDIEAYTWIPPTTKLGGESDISTTLKLPAEIGLGVSYKVKPEWSLNLDYSYTMWDRLDKVVVDLDTPLTVSPNPAAPQLASKDVVFNWENTSRISLGTEYNLGGNMLRAGLYFDQTPIPEETQSITLSDIGNKISTNIGWGKYFGRFCLDANFQYVMFSEREVTQGTGNMGGTYNAQSLSGNLGLSYEF